MSKTISFALLVFLLLACKEEPKEIHATLMSSKTKRVLVLSEKLPEKQFKEQGFRPEELRILRNEIYARRGYIFNSKDLTEYFTAFEWYQPRHKGKEIDSHLSEIDKHNIQVIANYEQELKEYPWIFKPYEEFTFEDFLASIPEFVFPLNFDAVEYKDEEALDRFYALDNEKSQKFPLSYGSPFGKIIINDSLTAIALSAASDLHVYHTVVIVDAQGNELDYFEVALPVESTSDAHYLEEDFVGEDTTTYTKTIINEDFTRVVTGWHTISHIDSLGNLSKDEYSDTITIVSEIKEITQFLE